MRWVIKTRRVLSEARRHSLAAVWAQLGARNVRWRMDDEGHVCELDAAADAQLEIDLQALSCGPGPTWRVSRLHGGAPC